MGIFKQFFLFFFNLRHESDLLKELIVRDFRSKFTGTYLGVAWVYIQPITFILILYFVFSVGLKRGGDSGEVPFFVYLSSGIIGWFYFSGNLGEGTSVVKQYSYLLKKINVNLSILPLVKLFSSLLTHVALIAFVIIMAILNHVTPSIYYLQLLYYVFCSFFLLLGVSWITSSVSIFVADVKKFIAIVIQFGFWLTPIFWNIKNIPEKYQIYLMGNPVFYIVQGYRDSIIYQIGFWEKPWLTLYFWGVTTTMCLVGLKIFQKLRPHFAEVI